MTGKVYGLGFVKETRLNGVTGVEGQPPCDNVRKTIQRFYWIITVDPKKKDN